MFLSYKKLYIVIFIAQNYFFKFHFSINHFLILIVFFTAFFAYKLFKSLKDKEKAKEEKKKMKQQRKEKEQQKRQPKKKL